MSQMPGADYYQLDDGEIAPEPYDPNMPRLRGGDASSHAYGTNRNYGQWAGSSVPAARSSFEHLPRQGPEGASEGDFYEVPATDFYAARGKRPQRGGRPAKGAKQFDFNDNEQPNPWHGAVPQPQPQRPRAHKPGYEPEVEPEIRRFATCRDRELLAYLEARGISVGFLHEIDQFIQAHPEIATCAEGRSTLRQISTLPPREAYLYFLKGYTRPARYRDGIIRTDNFPLPADYPYQPLSTRTDPELVDFFDGFDYRHDIIDRIDGEVRVAMRELAYGGSVPLALRKLVCYALWGNPVDAYKWFEYSYQKEYMPHRYLPEHVVLGHIPKPAGQDPQPRTIAGYKKHGDVRARMARANDQGVDVLEVLIAEYRFALVRTGHRRVDIDGFVFKAKQRLENERQNPTGVDIVDFIMDDASDRQGTNCRAAPRQENPRNPRTFNLGSHTVTFNGTNINGGSHAFMRFNERRAPGFLQSQAAELRAAKMLLVRLYTQEQHAILKGGINARQSTLQMVRSSRASAERRYVNCLIRYCRDANRMTPLEANQLQKAFTREKMGDMGFPNSNYLLGMYPRELY